MVGRGRDEAHSGHRVPGRSYLLGDLEYQVWESVRIGPRRTKDIT